MPLKVLFAHPISLLVATLAILVGFGLSGMGHAAAAAASSQSITISPASTISSIRPGGSQLYNLSILNDGSTSYTVRVYTSPYHVVGVNYDPSFVQVPGTTDPSDWVRISKPSVQVPAHETVVVPYTLTIPGGTAPGGYYAVIFVETQPSSNQQEGVQALSRVGDVLYITAQGVIRTGGSVIATPIPHFSTAKSLPLALEVSDTGGTHFVTNASILITNMLGRSVFRGRLQRIILPQTIRKISTNWKTPPVGLYHVSRSATVAGQSESLHEQWLVVVHPWVVVLFVVLLMLIIATALLSRRTKKRKTKEKDSR